jgi:hemerythrin-like domain-containing protein
MKPIGPLMTEHRLIERIVTTLSQELGQIQETRQIDEDFLIAAVDFFRTYADRTHHGKEEDILFRELAQKQLKPEEKRIMDELVQEHIQARKIVTRLANARQLYRQGDHAARMEIIICLKELASFYPPHIVKEDQHFFYPILLYFDKQEQDRMLEEFWEFDRKLIHEKYQKIVEENESRKGIADKAANSA